MNASAQLETARDIMDEFATDTGLTSAEPPRRYLWTDAHAVCNFIALAARLDRPAYLDTAVALVDQVHHVLGKHRRDDAREGWISGLGSAAGAEHPTAGGLRIGKTLPERTAEEPYDPQAEWDRDGQYFHYLTKWMHALYQTSQATADPRYLRWAQELAVTAAARFKTTIGSARLVWKMSIDLRRALVPSSGHHDPLDGYVTALVLQHAQPDESLAQTLPGLKQLCEGKQWATDDALGIGGLLFDACRLAQLPAAASNGEHLALLHDVAEAALQSLGEFQQRSPLNLPASHRLAFRELGMAMGLHGIDLLRNPLALREEAARYLNSVAGEIEAFWRMPAHQNQPTWLEHEDINRVMLAASLLSPAILEI